MKARRRHDLKQNVLDAELAKGVKFLKKRGAHIAWGVLIAALIIFAVVYIRSRKTSAMGNVQARFRQLTRYADNPGLAQDSPDASADNVLAGFKELAQQDTDERIAALSTVRVGEIYAQRAFVAAATDKTAQEGFLEDSAGYYRKAIASFPEQSQAVARAHLGLAQLAETRGDLDAARTEYKAVAAMGARAPANMVELAADSLKKLDKLDTRPLAATAPSPATKPSPPALLKRPETRPAPTTKPAPTTRPAPATKP